MFKDLSGEEEDDEEEEVVEQGEIDEIEQFDSGEPLGSQTIAGVIEWVSNGLPLAEGEKKGAGVGVFGRRSTDL